MSDLISRQAAIDAFWKLDVEIRPSVIDAIIEMLKQLPSAQSEPQWIPCDKKLPEIDKECLVTDGGLCWVCSLFESPDIEDGLYQWEDNYGYWHEFETWVAWMPLPEPYKERR